MENQSQNQLSVKILQIVWGFLFLWTGALVFLAVNGAADAPGDKDFSQMKLIFTVLAIGEFALALFLPSLVNRSRIQALPVQKTLPQMIQATFVGWIIQFALFESICLLGFVLVFAMTRQFNDMLPFLGLSYLGFILRFPTEEKIKKMCNSYE